MNDDAEYSSHNTKNNISMKFVDVPSTCTSSDENQNYTIQNQIYSFQSNFLEQSKINQDRTLSSDINIITSFLPHMQLLNDHQKLDFQLKGLQLLKNILYQK